MLLTPLAIGNAIRLTLKSPAGASRTRVLRKTADTFTGEFDAAAFVIYDGGDSRINVVDTASLVNGMPYHYRAYFLSGITWTATYTASATPLATYDDQSTDAMTIVRERLDLGLAVEVSRGSLSHDTGKIPVLTAPPLYEDTRWPLVSVHLQLETPTARAIGELIDPDNFDPDEDKWSEREGWLAKTQLTIIAWSLNPDERIELRKAIRRLVVANLSVFDAAGLIEIELSQQDIEDFSSYNAPVYQSMCTFQCLSSVVVAQKTDAIDDVQVEATV